MSLIEDRHQAELRAAGWHSRGYLPHFDGIELPQFITFHLADSMPRKVIERWQAELKSVHDEQQRLLLIRRVEKYLDQVYGKVLLKDTRVANMIQNSAAEVRRLTIPALCMGSHAESCALIDDAV